MKIKLNKSISYVLVFVTLIFSLGLSAFALSWDGSSSGGNGGGSPAGPNGYAIRTSGDNCLGYRFSVVDKWGNTKNDAVIDVFRNTSYGNMELSGAFKFDWKRNKKQNIDNQNNGFSSSKNTWNCYKEADMWFALGLPTPDGMNSWQNDSRNLNAVLNILGIGNIENLKNGDKVLVEPLFDIRLQGTYHSITVTEMALYGKWLLGANSNGGSSSTSSSWGFISTYTNKLYPNSLYTPDGQGLWWGVGALGGRGSFYDIVNGGYGVGIAYTETKSDFDPNLSVNVCEAWRGNASDRSYHFGTSSGYDFGNYSVGNGYPILNDSVWFAVNFPAESENIRVRQYVRHGGNWVTRDVNLNGGDSNSMWFDVIFTGNEGGGSQPTNRIEDSRVCYVVDARQDWIEGNGNVIKYGTEKSFYIPIRPKINNYQITMTDIRGNTAAQNGRAGASGKVYVGQQVYPMYTFTSDNTWTSYNYLRGCIYSRKNGEWQRAYSLKDGQDLYVDNAGLDNNSPYSKYSDIGLYRVPDNSGSDGNKIPFVMWTHWNQDIEHTTVTDWIDIPVIKADVELLDIKLIASDGNYITGRDIYACQTVTPQYVYKNNTDCTIYIEGYDDDTSRISGTFAIPPNGTISVNGKALTVPYGQFFDVWGGVYLDGAGRTNTNWEKEDYESQNNNHWIRYWNIKNPLSIDIIPPNAVYHEDTEVITSFKVKNAATANFYPSNNISVRFTVHNGSKLVYSTIKSSVVIPSENENLVYFKWKVPSGLRNANLSVKGKVVDGGKIIDESQLEIRTAKVQDMQTPDTVYEAKKPDYWHRLSVPNTFSNNAIWSEWVFENQKFTKKSYKIRISEKTVSLRPDSKSTSSTYENGIWSMKSGYGFTAKIFAGREFTGSPPLGAYTSVQHGYMQFPEFNYSVMEGKYRNLHLDSNIFRFKSNEAANGERIHYMPLWYPNGYKNYTTSSYFYDQWTPAGMISARLNSNSFTVNGSLYDDHYIGRK